MSGTREFEVKKPHGHCCVITAKPPEPMNKLIGRFWDDQHYNSRNDAIIVIVANGLRHLNIIGEEELKQYMDLYSPLPVGGDDP